MINVKTKNNISRNEGLVKMLEDLSFEDAVSHRIHSRLFEILGYISIAKDFNKNMSKEVEDCLKRIEEISNTLINELHTTIDFYSKKKKAGNLG